MKLMIQRLAHEMQGAPGTVFVVGAGSGAELPLWRELASPHLVLAEAHPRQVEELLRRTDPARNEEVWAQAIVATPATHATLQTLNNPLYSSLQPPNELTRHYPNLRVTGQVNVAARPLGESIESLMLDAASAHLLVIDAPGQAWDLLSATPVRLLQQFACIVVHCGIAPLYAGDRGRSDITDLLEKAGFDVGLDDPDAIYPQATVLLKRNDIRVKISRLEAQLRKREDQYAAQVKRGVERDARLEQLTREYDEQAALVSGHKAALDQANQNAAEQQKLAADRQTQLQKLTIEYDRQEKLAAQYKAELDEVRKALAEQQESVADQQERIQTLTAERDAQTRLAAQHMAALDQAKRHAAEQQKLAADRQTQLQKLTIEYDRQEKLAAQYKAELDEAGKALAEQQKSVADQQERVQTLTAERDAQTRLAAQHMAELDKATKAFTEQQKLVANQAEKLSGERDAQARLATQYKAERDQANKALAEQQKSVVDQQERIQTLTAERDAQAELATEHKAERGKVTQSFTEYQMQTTGIQKQLEARVSELENKLQTSLESGSALHDELSAAKQTVTLSIKSQALREADLKDLQDRYRVLLGSYQNQHELLTRLSNKLNAASSYFHLLSSEDISRESIGKIEGHSHTPTDCNES